MDYIYIYIQRVSQLFLEWLIPRRGCHCVGRKIPPNLRIDSFSIAAQQKDYSVRGVLSRYAYETLNLILGGGSGVAAAKVCYARHCK